nr:MAG TPA: hypothetical protein [Caudoviricetes sp.]
MLMIRSLPGRCRGAQRIAALGLLLDQANV